LVLCWCWRCASPHPSNKTGGNCSKKSNRRRSLQVQQFCRIVSTQPQPHRLIR
jgi:hypothetical protein